MEALIYFPLNREFTIDLPEIISEMDYTVSLYIDNLKVPEQVVCEQISCQVYIKQDAQFNYQITGFIPN